MEAVLVGVLLAPEAGAGGAFGERAEAVAPVIGIGEAASGPAKKRSFDGAHGFDEGGADAALVGDPGVGADPDAVVDDSAKLLDEVRVDLGRDGADGFGGEDLDVRVDLCGLRDERRGAEGQRRGGEGGGFEKARRFCCLAGCSGFISLMSCLNASSLVGNDIEDGIGVQAVSLLLWSGVGRRFFE